VWPRSIGLSADASRISGPIAKQTLELQPGDAVLFRGDLVHAGAAYKSDHLRMHCYLDSAAVKRAANATWLINSDNVDTRLRAAIQQ
jgi:ectoine hydroxylase-related dioxygenase (phytanoyl-CoA dioxygenase family)